MSPAPESALRLALCELWVGSRMLRAAAGRWAEDGNSWAKYENVVVDCPAPCTLSLLYRSSPHTSFPPQPPNASAPRRLALAVGAPLDGAEVAVIASAQSADWALLNASVAGGVRGPTTLFLRLDGQCEVDYFFFTTRAGKGSSSSVGH